MRQYTTRIVLTLLIAAGLDGCSSCRSSEPFGVQNSIGQRAWVTTRICGSVEGWVVKVRNEAGEEAEVFLAEMPDPTSVDDVPGYVTVMWAGKDQLVVTAPRWVRSFKQLHAWGAIQLQRASARSLVSLVSRSRRRAEAAELETLGGSSHGKSSLRTQHVAERIF